MKLAHVSPLAVFTEFNLDELEYESEFRTWVFLQNVSKYGAYTTESFGSTIEYYDPISNIDGFLDVQLKFFLVRNSKNVQNSLSVLLRYWVSIIREKYPFNSLVLTLGLQSNSWFVLNEYGKYYYSYESYLENVKCWNNRSIDLDIWKKFRYLEIP
jgi:hypothetical protein